MGRANPNRPTSARSSTSSVASSSQSQQQFLLIPTSEYDPAHPANLRRSLSRNDVELAALSKLHGQIRLLKYAIVHEYGEEILLECVLNEKTNSKKLLLSTMDTDGSSTIDNRSIDTNENDDKTTTTRRLHRLTTSFLLRMKLRRRLLNRLARRLHRVAHSMDILTNTVNNNNKNSVLAPLPPRYGDIVRRYLSMEVEESVAAASGGGGSGSSNSRMMMLMGNSMDNVHVIREKDVKEFMKLEDGKKEAKELLTKQRQERKKEVVGETVTAKGEEKNDEGTGGDDVVSMDVVNEDEEDNGIDKVEPPTPDNIEEDFNIDDDVDLLLRRDEEDRPYLDQLVEYEPGYDKLYSVETTVVTTTTTTPPVDAMEDHDREVAEDEDVAGDGVVVKPVNLETTTETGKQQSIKVTMPIVSTIDDHELNDDGLPVVGGRGGGSKSIPASQQPQQQSQPSRLPFTLTGSTMSSRNNGPHPKENAEEWKRWTAEILDKIPDQITFDELGVGGQGVVLELERRLTMNKKRKERREEEEEGGDGEKGKDAAAVMNQGKGKVLKKISSRDDEEDEDVNTKSKDDDEDASSDKDAVMEGSESVPTKDDETGNDTEKKGDKSKASITMDPKSTKTFSVLPVPSFHYLDLKRIRNLQNEMVKSLQVQRTRERVVHAQAQYDAAYNRSIELQQAKSAAMAELKRVADDARKEELDLSKSKDMMYGPAFHHWKKRQYQLQDMEVKYGKNQALNRYVSNDVIQDMKDRVCIRVSEELTGTGLGTSRICTMALKAQSEDDIHKKVSATMLGHMVDTVERRYNDMLADHTEFVLPPMVTSDTVIVDHLTGETMAQSHARKIGLLRSKITQLDSLFNEAEKKRCDRWAALNKARGGAGGAQSNVSTANNSTTASKPKPRNRKSTGAIVPPPGGGNAAVVGGHNRMSYPMQMQAHAQPIAPGYGQASYYDPQRAVMVSQQQIQARMLMQQQQQLKQQQESQQIAQVQKMLAQQQQQLLQERAAATRVGAMQYQSVPTNVGPQMRVVQDPEPRVNVVSSHPAPASHSSTARITTSEADGNVKQEQEEQQPEDTSDDAPSKQKSTSLSKYAYGDRYSQTNVNARKQDDGTVVPVSAPKLMPDGTFARPKGRQRKGMEWDAVKGCWYPLAEGQVASSWSGDDES